MNHPPKLLQPSGSQRRDSVRQLRALLSWRSVRDPTELAKCIGPMLYLITTGLFEEVPRAGRARRSDVPPADIVGHAIISGIRDHDAPVAIEIRCSTRRDRLRHTWVTGRSYQSWVITR